MRASTNLTTDLSPDQIHSITSARNFHYQKSGLARREALLLGLDDL